MYTQIKSNKASKKSTLSEKDVLKITNKMMNIDVRQQKVIDESINKSL